MMSILVAVFRDVNGPGCDECEAAAAYIRAVGDQIFTICGTPGR
jgi:hypothetical protein